MRPWINILIALMLCFTVAACSQSSTLVSSLGENEGNEALTLLLSSGIKAQKIPAGEGLVSIMVDSADLPAAIDILYANGFPKKNYAKFVEVFPKDSFTESPRTERARYAFFLAQNLEETLSSIEGVVVAKVHLVLPEKATFSEPLTQASASVFLKYMPPAQIDWMVPDIKKLISGSIPGLTSDRVNVVVMPDTQISRNQVRASSLKRQMLLQSQQNNEEADLTSLAQRYRLLLIGVCVAVIIALGSVVVVRRRRISKSEE